MKNTHKLLTLILASLLAVACSGTNNSGGGGDDSIPPHSSGGQGDTSIPGGSSQNENPSIPDDKIVEDIALKTLPKQEYVVGEEFSIAGGIIELQFEDGTTQDIPFTHELVTITTPDMSTPGVKTVIVDYDGFKQQYQITVKKQSYLITLDLNYEGAVNPAPIEVVAGEYASKPTDPLRTDYRFVDWCTDKLGEHPFDFSTTVIESSFTLYASWEQEFAVYFDLDDGSAKVKVAATLNAPIMMNVAPSVLRTGYQFLGWYNGDTLYNFATPVTAALNLKAHWQAIAADKSAFVVEINYNAGDAYARVKYYVEEGATTFTPSDPVIEGKEFQGWYKAPQGNDQFNFSDGITTDTVIYAHYVVDHYTVNFKYVANGVETTFRTKTVQPGQKVTTVAQKPRVENYLFDGKWYSNKACTTLFDFNQEIYADYDLYTKALKKNVFETEYTYIDPNKPGVGSSDSFTGLKLVFEDNGTAEASNGYWVSGLYNNGSFVEYVIYSEKDFSDGQMEMSLSSEWADIYIAPENMTVSGQNFYAFEVAAYQAIVDADNKVMNDSLGYARYDETTKQTVDYQPIALEGAVPFSVSAYDKRAFDNHFMTDHFALHQGYNVIRLTVRNNVSPYDGTMNAHAPMIDNLVIYTDSELSWTPHEENVADWTQINFAPNKHGL